MDVRGISVHTEYILRVLQLYLEKYCMEDLESVPVTKYKS